MGTTLTGRIWTQAEVCQVWATMTSRDHNSAIEDRGLLGPIRHNKKKNKEYSMLRLTGEFNVVAEHIAKKMEQAS